MAHHTPSPHFPRSARSARSTRSYGRRTAAQDGSARIVLLVLGCFLLGVAATALWFNRSGHSGVKPVTLSETTKAVLANLREPVEIRFYSVLDTTNLPPSVPALAAHAGRLLTAYEQVGDGKIKVSRFDSGSEADANAAAGDGMKGFNRERGSVCYLGIAVAGNGKTDTLPQLSPEWENALEIDLTRAIARVSQSETTATAVQPAQISPAIKEELQRVVPNLGSVSLEDGTKLIRENSLKGFQTAAQEFQKQIEQAEQQLKQAQANGSPAEQQAAMQHLQQLQAGQSEKLKAIAADAQAQVDALKQLKSAQPQQ